MGTKYKQSDFCIKGSLIYSFLLYAFLYCIHTHFHLVQMGCAVQQDFITLVYYFL